MNTKTLGNASSPSKKKQTKPPLISNQSTLLAVLALMLTFFFGTQSIITNINSRIDEVDKRLDAKIDTLKDQMSAMQGDIKVLLDRSSRGNQKSEK